MGCHKEDYIFTEFLEAAGTEYIHVEIIQWLYGYFIKKSPNKYSFDQENYGLQA